jgi:hypothetical protein
MTRFCAQTNVDHHVEVSKCEGCACMLFVALGTATDSSRFTTGNSTSTFRETYNQFDTLEVLYGGCERSTREITSIRLRT